jgi:hypothetical protein
MSELTAHSTRPVAKSKLPIDAAGITHGHSHDQAHDQAHNQAYGQVHSHDAGHAHHHGPPHRHEHAGIPALQVERADPPRLSLMALSAGQRVILALPVVAFLWLLTFWAMRDG